VTAPLPKTPGDAREDHAQAVADAVAAIYGQIELVLIATLAALARKVAAGHMTRANAARKLRQATYATFAASVRKIGRALGDAMAATDQAARQAIGETVPSEPTAVRDMLAYTRQLAQSLDQAAGTAAAALQDALTTVTDAAAKAAEATPAAPLRGVPGAAEGPRNIFSPYRDAVERAIADTRGGMPQSSLSLSRIQAAQKALDDLADRGVTGFTDRAGRNWDLTAYVEMATRTAVSNAWDGMQAKAMIRSGLDLIRTYTTSTEGSCPLCIPWLGMTLSLTGATAGYPTLGEATSAGFRHPNCRCSWIPVGTGPAPGAVGPVSPEQAAAAYKASQKQRALERNVRKAGRAAHAAVTPQARSKARRNLAAARAASAQHRQEAGVVMTKAGAARREHPFRAH
jgi:hypothetical protein